MSKTTTTIHAGSVFDAIPAADAHAARLRSPLERPADEARSAHTRQKQQQQQPLATAEAATNDDSHERHQQHVVALRTLQHKVAPRIAMHARALQRHTLVLHRLHARLEARAAAIAGHGWRDAFVLGLDKALGRAAARSAHLNRELGLPPYAPFLPPHAHAAMAERHARDALRAQGAEDTHHMRAWHKAHDVMSARTTKEMLYAPARWLKAPRRMRAASPSPRPDRRAPSAPRQCALQGVCRKQLEHVDRSYALYTHRNTPLAQRSIEPRAAHRPQGALPTKAILSTPPGRKPETKHA